MLGIQLLSHSLSAYRSHIHCESGTGVGMTPTSLPWLCGGYREMRRWRACRLDRMALCRSHSRVLTNPEQASTLTRPSVSTY